MSRTHAPFPSPPIDPPLGTVYRPDVPNQDGPMAKQMEGMTSLVRVKKRCRECAQDYDGWIFLGAYQQQESSLEEPYNVGLYRMCDRCIGDSEQRAEITKLERMMEVESGHWSRVRTVTMRLPVARRMVQHLEKLCELLRFGTDKFIRYSDQLDKVRNWTTKYKTEDEVAA